MQSNAKTDTAALYNVLMGTIKDMTSFVSYKTAVEDNSDLLEGLEAFRNTHDAFVFLNL